MCTYIYIYITTVIRKAKLLHFLFGPRNSPKPETLNPGRIPFGDHPTKLERTQRRLAWPLRKDDAHKVRSVPKNLKP